MPPVIVLENVTGLMTPRSASFLDAICDRLHRHELPVRRAATDAALFKQSCERVFIVAVDAALPVPVSITRPRRPSSPSTRRRSSPPWAVKKAAPIWWRLPVPPVRNTVFADLIEDNPTGVPWHDKIETERLIAMMAPADLAKVADAKRASIATGRKMVGGLYRRTRPAAGGEDVAGQRVQRAEVRFDDVAGCLRVPSGGSSRQTILVVDGGTVRSRLLSPREAARLMGFGDDYRLPSNVNEALGLMGDGLAIQVVRHLTAHVLEPVLRENKLSLVAE